MRHYNNQDYEHQPRIIEVDKFFLHVFNYLVYNYEISEPLATSTFLSFSKYYTQEKLFKQIHLKTL